MEYFTIRVEEKSKNHNRLLHYCSLDTLERIMCDKTFRASSLGYIGLNDQFEKLRNGIEEYANDFFIVCFSNYQQEIVPFWYNYAGDNLKEKVLLKFKNFTTDMTEIIETDYLYTSECKKMFFTGINYNNMINQNGILGEAFGLSKVNFDYELRNSIKTLKVKDVEYLPIADNVFTKSYREKAQITFDEGKSYLDSNVSDLTSFGYYKTEHWAYEHETRLIFAMQTFGITKFDFILLRLQDKIFEDLVIVENPWSDTKCINKIRDIISISSVNEEIKKTITINSSELYGFLNE